MVGMWPDVIRSAADPARRRIFERGDVIGAGALIACVVVSVIAADGAALKVVVAVLGLCAELGMVLSGRALPTPLTWFGVALTIGTGFAIMALVPDGLGEVPVLAGAAVLPMCVPAGPVRNACVALLAVVFGVAVMVVFDSVAGLLSAVGVWLLADRSIEHAALQAERDRAVALLAEVEASRASRQEAAALEERRRIAHEMHDVLAHSLAGLSMQLQAVRAIARRDGAPAALTEPLDRAAELARDGVQEARAAVSALRSVPLRGVADIDGLTRGFPGEARLRVSGRAGRLTPGAGHAVYRAVQEGMTNAARYATGSAIDVVLAWEGSELRAVVRDRGLPAGRRPSGVQGSGTGLRGMAERIEAVGGSLTAGPAPEGPGWRITLRVPVVQDAGAEADTASGDAAAAGGAVAGGTDAAGTNAGTNADSITADGTADA
ncbi:sensor histidine kinase [Kitasatospora sp. NBC_01287]|uniref:sensor histidine kinase n=1 Tax=Kitasatospora sp. NBC_01287 TaxID=2903573 RepID=UPI002259F940|nr:sensor histidine kinase [Kitasatospora sp. NBC_01287]MCX4746257.1 sensor histidine kinase [Kitasatospora sp. NBC_01287]